MGVKKSVSVRVSSGKRALDGWIQGRGHGLSCREFSADKVSQRSHCGENGTINVAVVDNQAKLFLQTRDQRDDRHRIKLGDGAQQGRRPVEGGRATIQTEDFIKHAK